MSSPNIYLPYVYIVTHKITGQFYIGMRSANKVIAEQDFGIKYFTSSKYVKQHFDEFKPKILAYFVDQESAFLFENTLIKENFNNPLILNRHYQLKMTTFSMRGAKRKDLSDLNRRRSKPKEFREYECISCRDTFYKEEFLHHHRQLLPFCCQACAASYNIGLYIDLKRKNKPNYKSKEMSLEFREKMTILRKRKPPSTKGMKFPNQTGKNNVMNRPEVKEKLSKRATGRRKKYREDGSWFWENPTTSVAMQVGTAPNKLLMQL